MVFRKGKLRAARQPAEARLLAMRDLLGDEQREEVMVGPLLLLGAHDEVAPDAARIGEVQALEQAIEVDVGRLHRTSSCCGRGPRGSWLCRACAMYSAPNRLLGEAAREGRAQRRRRRDARAGRAAARRRASTARAAMGELGEVLQGRPAELEQMLALQVALGALARDRGHALRAVLGQGRAARPESNSRGCTASKRPATMRTRSR